MTDNAPCFESLARRARRASQLLTAAGLLTLVAACPRSDPAGAVTADVTDVGVPGGLDVPVGQADVTDVGVPGGLDAPASEDSSVADASASVCDPWSSDRTQQDIDAINRIGLLLSPARVEGTLGAPVPDGEGARAPLTITKVWFGPTFLEGETVWVDLDPAEVAALDLPSSAILGFGGNPYPTVDDDGQAVWWSMNAAIPVERRETVADLLGYSADLAPSVGVVRIVGQDADRTRFEVVETLAGELPKEISTNWTTSVYAAPFPGVSDALFIAGFREVTWTEAAGLHLGTTIDFRPWTEEAEAEVVAAFADPEPALDGAALSAARETYLEGWAFHRAPDVVATTVTGIAGECCTGAGGTYYAHDVVADLRGTAAASRLMLGGHGYPDDGACGDDLLLGLYGLEGMTPEPASAFSCDLASAPSLPTGLPVPVARVQRPDTPAGREQVLAWLSANEPLYRLHAETDVATLPAIDGPSPWSTPVTVEQALSIGSVWLIDIVATAPVEGGTEVTLETTFAAHHYDHLERHRAKVVFPCGDPRLLEVGSSWLVPVVVDGAPKGPSDLDASGAFLVPGVLLPDQAHIQRVISLVASAVASGGAP